MLIISDVYFPNSFSDIMIFVYIVQIFKAHEYRYKRFHMYCEPAVAEEQRDGVHPEEPARQGRPDPHAAQPDPADRDGPVPRDFSAQLPGRAEQHHRTDTAKHVQVKVHMLDLQCSVNRTHNRPIDISHDPLQSNRCFLPPAKPYSQNNNNN